MRLHAGCLGVLVVVGCQFPKPADAPADASPTDAPIDARPELVQGSWKFRHMIGDDVTDGSLDLSAFSVQALIPSGDGLSPTPTARSRSTT